MTRAEEFQEARRAALAELDLELPRAYRGADLEQLDEDDGNRRAVATLRRYIEELPRMFPAGVNVILQGDVGRGKTYLAVALARTIAKSVRVGRQGVIEGVADRWRHHGLEPINRVTFRSWAALLEAEKDEINKEAKRHPIRSVARVPWLILDDIGVEGTLTEFARGRLFYLVDERMRNLLPTVITTNLRLARGEGGELGERVVSRLLEANRSISRTLEGPDRRAAR